MKKISLIVVATIVLFVVACTSQDTGNVEAELAGLSDEQLAELAQTESDATLSGQAAYEGMVQYKRSSPRLRESAMRKTMAGRLMMKQQPCPEVSCPQTYLSEESCKGQTGYECSQNDGYSPTNVPLKENFESCNNDYGSKEECERATQGVCKEDTYAPLEGVWRHDRDHDGKVGCGEFEVGDAPDDCPRHPDMLCR